MKILKIYLADITYDTVSISTEAFPLNVGFIATYCKKQFGENVDIKIFKYIDKLDKAIHDDPPHILAISNYCWSHNVSSEIFKMMREINPETLTVWGGPNFPMDVPSQEKFMAMHPEVDVYVPIEGEIGFSNIVKQVFKSNSEKKLRETLLDEPIENCVLRDKNGKLSHPISGNRIDDLTEIPSPYTSGLLDEFFDGKLAPMLQTNRGCPFTCTFCTDGVDDVNKVNKFSSKRVKEDINYIATHIPENVHTLYISDLNFGMYAGDLETCNAIHDVQQKYGYPKKILATTGKNQKEKIIESIKRLNGTMALSMSVQSMNDEVLSNIRRPNISVEKMLELAPTIKEYDIRTTSELILGLPGETYDNHIEGLRKLIAAKMDFVVIHTCMLLPGSEMCTPEQRKKWKFKTKFRIIPRDFAKLSNGKKVFEIEEIVVGSNSMTFDEFLELRLLGFILWVTNQGVVYDAILKFLHEQKVDVFELFYKMIKESKNLPVEIQNVFKKFKQAAIDELWNSPEDIKTHFEKDDNYNKLLNGEGAINVIQYHHAMILTDIMDLWTEYVIEISSKILEENNKFDDEHKRQFNNIANYCRGVSYNPLKENRMLTNPEFQFSYDVLKWLKKDNISLDNFKSISPIKLKFQYSEEQNKIIQDNLNFYGNNLIGKTKALKAIPFQILWRKPIGIKSPPSQGLLREIETKRWNTL